MSQLYGCYSGADDHLKGKYALLRLGVDAGEVLAQFDDVCLLAEKPTVFHDGTRCYSLGCGWHKFRIADFVLEDTKHSRIGMGEFMVECHERRQEELRAATIIYLERQFRRRPWGTLS